ncbi:MAG TPA: LCP family protein [Pseudonocardia sp.]|uniref:LCP family protein n=1 Tax=Pseudonocardia sp. TaxID=60912 RepID=UPI002C782138|nr:LCP family protein [Pseudonocardia sp.]HTF49563.1 LCP family protein [Pseudonocardia sp.]
MDDGAEHDSAPGSRRRRDADAQGGLSVADLLARHGLEPRAAADPGTRHRLNDRRIADEKWPDGGSNWPDSGADWPGGGAEWPGSDDQWRDWSVSDQAAAPDQDLDRVLSGRDDHLVDYDLREDYLVDYRPREVELGMTDRLFPAAVFALPSPTELGDADPDDSPTAVVPATVLPPEQDPMLPAAVGAAEEVDTVAVGAVAAGAGQHAGLEDPSNAEVLSDDEDEYDSEDEYETEYPDDGEDQDGAENPGARHRAGTGDPAGSEDQDDRAGSHRVADPEDDDGFELRTRRIDESLTRLTAIHAGLGREMTERVSRSTRLAIVDRTGDESPDDGLGPDGAGPDGGGPDDGGPPAPRYPGWSRAGQILALVAAVALLAGTAAGWGTQAWLNGKLRSVNALDPNASTVVDLAAQAGDQNYLLVGTEPAASRAPDATPDRTSDSPSGGTGPAAAPGAGLDTVMLVHVPANGDRAVLTSFPTDLAVDRPSCDRWDPVGAGYPGGTSPAQSAVPLTATYTLGGPRCLTKTIQQLTGLSVNHYTGMDVTGLAGMVDAVHGVPVCLARPGGTSLTAAGPAGSGPAGSGPGSGPTVLVGAQAVDFIRATSAGGAGNSAAAGTPDAAYPSDPIQRQQLFITALLRKATSDQVLFHLGDLRGFVTAFGGHSLSDNAGLGQLGTLARSLQGLDPAKVFLASAPTAGAAGAQLDAGPAKALFDAIRTDGPLPGEGGAAAPGVDDSTQGAASGGSDTVAPSAVTLNVRNGSSRKGLANQAADSLRPLGFTVASVGDAPPSEGGRTVIRHSADRSDQAAALADAVPSAVSETVPGVTGMLDLVLGDGFDGQVRAAPVASSGAPATAIAPVAVRTLSALAGSCG